jgi:hypothetical protein
MELYIAEVQAYMGLYATVCIFSIYLRGWGGTMSIITAAPYWCIVPVLDDRW